MAIDKEFHPDTGNIIESVYSGVEQSKKQPIKKIAPKPIKNVDDVPPKNQKKT